MDPAHSDFRDFFESEIGALRRLAYRLTGNWSEADELAQDAMVRTFRAWRRIRESDRPAVYARAALINRHRSLLRRAASEARHAFSRAQPQTEHPADLSLARAIRAALLEVPMKQRHALVLFFYEDRPQAEIARILGCREGTVKSLVHRGLARLRAELGESDPRLETEGDRA